MSLVYNTTQARPVCIPEGSQPLSTVFIIYTNQMSQRQTKLMKECQDCLHRDLQTAVKHSSEISQIPMNARFFVIPSIREDLVESVKKLVSPLHPCIYTPRLIIEARERTQIRLPPRSICISLSMQHCHIFLTKNCNQADIRRRIHEMFGNLVPSFQDDKVNVVVADRADDKYCIKARQRSVVCVSRLWVDESHSASLREDEELFGSNSLKDVRKYELKAFFGLRFKLSIKQSTTYVRNLIAENQGKILLGDENPKEPVTHEVVEDNTAGAYLTEQSTNGRSTGHARGSKKVDVMFVEACARLGYYLSSEEYTDYRDNETDQRVTIKQEPVSQRRSSRLNPSQTRSGLRTQSSVGTSQGFTPPISKQNTRLIQNIPVAPTATNGHHARPQMSQSNHENHSMRPPSQIPRQSARQHQQQLSQQRTQMSQNYHQHNNHNQQQQQQQNNNQSDSMSQVILRALSENGYDNGAISTQLASTQMRTLPERTIQIEQTAEPSQQLYWSDTVSRRG